MWVFAWFYISSIVSPTRRDVFVIAHGTDSYSIAGTTTTTTTNNDNDFNDNNSSFNLMSSRASPVFLVLHVLHTGPALITIHYPRRASRIRCYTLCSVNHTFPITHEVPCETVCRFCRCRRRCCGCRWLARPSPACVGQGPKSPIPARLRPALWTSATPRPRTAEWLLDVLLPSLSMSMFMDMLKVSAIGL